VTYGSPFLSFEKNPTRSWQWTSTIRRRVLLGHNLGYACDEIYQGAPEMNSHTSRLVFSLLACTFFLALTSIPALAADTLDRVGPVNSGPTDNSFPGKVIWVDLVTSDVKKAADFYHTVFGWDIRYGRDGSFARATYQGSPLATLSRYEEGEAPDGEARWLISISVADVDAAAAAVDQKGGELLEGPADLPDRGRHALVSDAQGALFMLLETSDGDPDDESPVDNSWLWAELWSEDLAGSASFYQSVVGYKSKSVKDASGDEVLLLGNGKIARASVVKKPWKEVEPNWLPYLQVADVTATAKQVLEHGGEVVVAPMLDSDGSRVAIVADPTGGVFAIQQRGDK
jgi:predicted enzyme related to lactoylglutathione lyase